MNKIVNLDIKLTKPSLLKFAFPGIIMVLINSLYEIIDGFFVSNYVGADAFAAINTAFPPLIFLSSIGMMIGAGGSTLIGNKLGEGDSRSANKYFSLLIYFAFLVGIIVSIIAFVFCRPVIEIMGAKDQVLDISVYYCRVSSISLTGYIIMMAFTSFVSASGKPIIGFVMSIIGLVVITSFDFIFTVIFKLGINGILIGTLSSEILSASFVLFYYSCKKNTSMIRIVSLKNCLDLKNTTPINVIGRACYIGIAGMLQAMASNLVVMVTIFQINKYIGNQGVVAYGVIEYAWTTFNCFNYGFAFAIAPVMSYFQGNKNYKNAQLLFKNSIMIILIFGVISFCVSQILAKYLVMIFVGYDDSLIDISLYALRACSISFLYVGIPIYSSSLFTSLGNGTISSVIAITRTVVLELLFLFILPVIFGGNGIWFCYPSSEFLASILSIILICVFASKYKIVRVKK